MTGIQLRHDIVDELEFDPSFDAAHIGVAVDEGVVSLTGHVKSYAEKVAAISAAQRVKGVHAIAENIEVRCPFQSKTADDQIAKRASANVKSKIESALKRHTELEAKAIQVTVQNGNKVILAGKVDNWDERRAVENAAWSAAGVASVEDRLTIG